MATPMKRMRLPKYLSPCDISPNPYYTQMDMPFFSPETPVRIKPVCVVCGKTNSPLTQPRSIGSDAGIRKNLHGLLLKYGRINITEGSICKLDEAKLLTLHKNCSAFKRQCLETRKTFLNRGLKQCETTSKMAVTSIKKPFSQSNTPLECSNAFPSSTMPTSFLVEKPFPSSTMPTSFLVEKPLECSSAFPSSTMPTLFLVEKPLESSTMPTSFLVEKPLECSSAVPSSTTPTSFPEEIPLECSTILISSTTPSSIPTLKLRKTVLPLCPIRPTPPPKTREELQSALVSTPCHFDHTYSSSTQLPNIMASKAAVRLAVDQSSIKAEFNLTTKLQQSEQVALIKLVESGDVNKIAQQILNTKQMSLRNAVVSVLQMEQDNVVPRLKNRKHNKSVLMKHPDSTALEQLENFSWEKIVMEFARNFPELYNMSLGLLISPESRSNPVAIDSVLPRLGMVYAICAQNRVPGLSQVQRMVAAILKEGLCDVKVFNRLGPAGLTISYDTTLDLMKDLSNTGENLLIKAIQNGLKLRK